MDHNTPTTTLEELVGLGLLDAIPDGLIVCGHDGSIRAVNQRFQVLSGYTSPELVGTPIEFLVPVHLRPRHELHRDTFARSGHPARPMGRDLDINLLRRDGTTIPADIALSSLDVGRETLVVATVRDATDRRSMEVAVADREHRLRQLYDNSSLIVVGHGIDGRITDGNPALSAITGLDTIHLIGENVARLIPEARSVLARLAEDEDYVQHDGEISPPGARGRAVSWHTVSLRNASGLLIGALSVGEDLTDRHRHEGAIRAMRAVSEAILQGRDPVEVQRLICEQARALAEASVALVATAGTPGENLVIQVSAGATSEDLVGATLASRFWEGLAQDGGPVVVDPIPELNSLLGRDLGPTVLLPLRGEESAGYLIVADELGSPDFSPDVIETLDTFAVQVSLSIAYGRRLKALAIADDRDRIARDLHDLVIQRLFAAGLSLQAAAQTLQSEPEIVTRLRQIVDSLDTAIAELRQSIFRLGRKQAPTFGETVAKLVDETLAGLELESKVVVDPRMSAVPEEVTRHVLATLREALTNTGRHASASRVEVEIQHGPELVLVVRDDGIGLAPDRGSRGHGLANMTTRARELGGVLELTQSHLGGLELRWRVPL